MVKKKKKDLELAHYWFQESANNKNRWAQFNLGYMYFNGIGVTQDKSVAKKWFLLSAQQNHEHAKIYLGKYDDKDLWVNEELKMKLKIINKDINFVKKLKRVRSSKEELISISKSIKNVEWNNENFKIVSRIGHGSEGVVFLCVVNKINVAVKIFLP